MPLKFPAVTQLVIVPALCPKDPVLMSITQDVRFRQALSLALDREEIKEAIFLGTGRIAQATIWKGSVFFEEEFEKPFIEHDVKRANRLLDEMGLDRRDGDNFRLRPDDKTLTLMLIYYSEVSPFSSTAAELLTEYYRDIGIKVLARGVSGQYFWKLHKSGEVDLTIWHLDGSIDGMHWYAGFHVPAPFWWQWYETDGESGVEPPAPAKRVYELCDVIRSTTSEEERIMAGKEILRIQAENLWVIGTVADTKSPFVYSKRLGNISKAEQKNYNLNTVLDAAEQWFFKR